MKKTNGWFKSAVALATTVFAFAFTANAGEVTAKTAAARIGDTYYATLEEALDAAALHEGQDLVYLLPGQSIYPKAIVRKLDAGSRMLDGAYAFAGFDDALSSMTVVDSDGKQITDRDLSQKVMNGETSSMTESELARMGAVSSQLSDFSYGDVRWVISFDRDVVGSTISLAGHFGNWADEFNWLVLSGGSLAETLEAGKPYVIGGNWFTRSYYSLQQMDAFYCGIRNNDMANVGKTATVALVLSYGDDMIVCHEEKFTFKPLQEVCMVGDGVQMDSQLSNCVNNAVTSMAFTRTNIEPSVRDRDYTLAGVIVAAVGGQFVKEGGSTTASTITYKVVPATVSGEVTSISSITPDKINPVTKIVEPITFRLPVHYYPRRDAAKVYYNNGSGETCLGVFPVRGVGGAVSGFSGGEDYWYVELSATEFSGTYRYETISGFATLNGTVYQDLDSLTTAMMTAAYAGTTDFLVQIIAHDVTLSSTLPILAGLNVTLDLGYLRRHCDFGSSDDTVINVEAGATLTLRNGSLYPDDGRDYYIRVAEGGKLKLKNVMFPTYASGDSFTGHRVRVVDPNARVVALVNGADVSGATNPEILQNFMTAVATAAATSSGKVKVVLKDGFPDGLVGGVTSGTTVIGENKIGENVININDVTVDLNGQEWTFSRGKVFDVQAGSKLTLTNGTIRSNWLAEIDVAAGGTLVTDGLTVEPTVRVNQATPDYVARVISANGTTTNEYETLAAAITAAKAGETVEIIKAGDYTLPDILKKITVKAAVAGVRVPYTNGEQCFGQLRDATIDGIEFDIDGNNVYYRGFNWNDSSLGPVTFKNCSFNKVLYTYGSQIFDHCTFNQAATEYSIVTYGPYSDTDHVDFIGCTFNGKGKYFNVFIEVNNTYRYTVNIEDCTFNNSAETKKVAVLVKEYVDSEKRADNNITVNFSGENALVGNFPADKSYDSAVTAFGGDGLWAVEGCTPANGKVFVVENDNQAYPEQPPVAQVTIGGVTTKYSDLNAALTAAKMSGAVCELLSDVDLTGKTWTPVGTATKSGDVFVDGFMGTFDGKGYTISGLTVDGAGMIGLIGFANEATIKNVTVTGASVTGTGDNVAVLAGGGFRTLVKNVTITNSTVSTTGEYAAAITGGAYTDVFDSRVVDTQITGKEQVGGVIGYACGAEINNNFVSNVTVKATAQRAGLLVGKYNEGDGKSTVLTNVVQGTVVTPTCAGGLIGQLMGSKGGWLQTFEIRGNAIDATLTTEGEGTKNPIGILRDGQDAEFTSILSERITGNTWTKATLDADSFQYTNVGTGVEPQTIWNGEPPAAYVAQVTIGGVTTKYTDLNKALVDSKAAGAVCELLSDVDLTGVAWTPVAGFGGTFDGKGFTISGLTVSGAGYVGLFASLNGAAVKDLTISGANVTATGDKSGILAAEVASGAITNVKVVGSEISSSGEYVGGLFGIGYSAVSGCEIATCTITGKEQTGGAIGYMWVGSIEGCTATNNTVKATSRAGGLIGKVQVAKDNIGPVPTAKMWVNGNTVSGTVDGGDMAGGLTGQIMGDDTRYEIKNNAIDATLTGTAKNPVGNLRNGQNAAFTSALAANITGNTWTKTTLDADSFTYENVASGVEPQTIWNGEPPVCKIVETGAKCSTLADAIGAVADGETIAILTNITATGWVKVDRPGIGFTIDLCGMTIERTDGSLFDIYSKVTFKDSVGTGLIKAHGRALYGNSGADFTLESGTVMGAEGTTINVIGAFGLSQKCIFTMNGGIVTNTGDDAAINLQAENYGAEFVMNDGMVNAADCGISCFGNNTANGSKITVNGGTVNAAIEGISVNGSKDGSVIAVNGGEINGTDGCGIYAAHAYVTVANGVIAGSEAIVIKGGSLAVSGGELTAIGAAYDPAEPGESAYAKTGDALYVEDNYNISDYSFYHTISVNITGGSFTSVNGNAVSARFSAAGKTPTTVTVAGGRFKCANGKKAFSTTDFTGTISASGGVYSVKPEDAYIVSGKVAAANPDSATCRDYPWSVLTSYTVTFTTDKGTAPEATNYVLSATETMLPKPTNVTEEGVTFNGWKFGDTEFVANAIPAGTTNDLALTATWTDAQKIEVKETEASAEPTVEIKVTQEWIDENVTPAGEEPTTAEIQTELNKKDENGNLKWQNYVIGLDPTNNVAGVMLQNDDEKTVAVVANVAEPQADTGFTVKYSLDQVQTNGTVIAAGEATTPDNLDIDLDGVESNAFFKVNVIVTKDDGTGEATKIAATNTLGVLKVTKAPATSIVAVPWDEVGGTAVTVANYVKTASLSEGDQLYVYTTNGTYSTWALDADKEWYSTGKEEKDPAEETIARGSAVWVKRQDSSKPLVLFGQASSASSSTSLDQKKSDTDPSWNIVAAPTVAPIDLNERFNADTKEGVTQDQVIVPTDGPPKNYTFMNGAWGYNETVTITNKAGKVIGKKVRVTDDTKIPAGTGFWYLNRGNATEVKW